VLAPYPPLTIKVALLSSSYTANLDTHAHFSDVSANEVTGAGYTAGGNTLTGVTVSYDSTARTATLNASSTTWSALTATVHYAVVYVATGNPTTSSLLGLLDFGIDRTYNGEPFELSFPSGVFTVGIQESVL
jgi:hypothetical protein